MAHLERRGDRFRIIFRYNGQRYLHTLKTAESDQAEAARKRVEANLYELEQGRLTVPEGAELALFLMSDGKAATKQKVEKPTTLRALISSYNESFTEGAKEANTRYTERIHFAHLLRLIGDVSIRSITTATLQHYVKTRRQEQTKRGDVVSVVTVKKEIGSFASLWNKFALPGKLVSGPAPTKGIVYGKSEVKPPFQTWEEIERKIELGSSEDLWDSLFLKPAETEQLLAFVSAKARHPFLYPMFVFAAHTGARRSELLRSLREDFDFRSGMVTIREKKKDTSKTITFRHVPLSPLLQRAMKDWFRDHPGGSLTFATEEDVALTPQLAQHHLRWLLDGSKWKVLKGWHVLRHSFITACVMRGIDQRMVDLWVGHTTDAMRHRYTHLIPSVARNALASVFG